MVDDSDAIATRKTKEDLLGAGAWGAGGEALLRAPLDNVLRATTSWPEHTHTHTHTHTHSHTQGAPKKLGQGFSWREATTKRKQPE